MITEILDGKLNDGSILCRHTIEIYCSNCGRDVDEAELAAKKCNDCGDTLEEPEQHVAIVVANMSFGGRTLE
jgi:ribosomal protein S27E